ncbi:zinc finger protein 721-like isoform X1 [Euwallacea fornicatus]|uniref:zinc finger protein 721-like isoform X1 n=1 Tax=Euwallacea fornicatus TaxID=995702 RepID=UPI00338EC2D0
MDNPGEILRLCRLCLVKDQVNIPIFEEQGDIRQTFLKIRSCLPVKVSRDDKLPKKICGGCSNKLDLFYEFWSSTANSEKTLQSWLGQEEEDDKMQEITKPVEALVKEESEALDDGHAHDQSFDEATKDEAEAPPAKRARRTAAVKAQINISHDSDEDEDVDGAEPITKIEDESDDSDGEEKDPSYTEVPGTSADDQAGPSGLGKDGVEAPEVSACESQLSVPYSRCKSKPKLDSLQNLTLHIIREPFTGITPTSEHSTTTKETEQRLERIETQLSSGLDGLIVENNNYIYSNQTPTLVCSYCDKSFFYYSDLKKHKSQYCQPYKEFRKAHRGLSLTQKNICKYCSLKFKSAAALKTHVIIYCKFFKKWNNSIKKGKLKGKRVRCTSSTLGKKRKSVQSGDKFETENVFLESGHDTKNVRSKVPTTDFESSIECVNRGSIKRSCEICGCAFKYETDLVAHKFKGCAKLKAPDSKTCQVCGLRCLYESDLTIHVKKAHSGSITSEHHNSDKTVSVNDKVTLRAASAGVKVDEKDQQTSSKPSKFRCLHCNLSFKTQPDVSTHKMLYCTSSVKSDWVIKDRQESNVDEVKNNDEAIDIAKNSKSSVCNDNHQGEIEETSSAKSTTNHICYICGSRFHFDFALQKHQSKYCKIFYKPRKDSKSANSVKGRRVSTFDTNGENPRSATEMNKNGKKAAEEAKTKERDEKALEANRTNEVAKTKLTIAGTEKEISKKAEVEAVIETSQTIEASVKPRSAEKSPKKQKSLITAPEVDLHESENICSICGYRFEHSFALRKHKALYCKAFNISKPQKTTKTNINEFNKFDEEIDYQLEDQEDEQYGMFDLRDTLKRKEELKKNAPYRQVGSEKEDEEKLKSGKSSFPTSAIKDNQNRKNWARHESRAPGLKVTSVTTSDEFEKYSFGELIQPKPRNNKKHYSRNKSSPEVFLFQNDRSRSPLRKKFGYSKDKPHSNSRHDSTSARDHQELYRRRRERSIFSRHHSASPSWRSRPRHYFTDHISKRSSSSPRTSRARKSNSPRRRSQKRRYSPDIPIPTTSTSISPQRRIKSFSRHYSSTSNENEIVQSYNVKRYGKIVPNAKTIYCEKCGESIRSYQELLKPRCKHYENVFPCPVCSLKFRDLNTLILHLEDAHESDDVTLKELKNSTNKVRYYCYVCGKEFNYIKNLISHKTLYHKFFHVNSSSTPVIRSANPFITGYVCRVCNKKLFSNLELLLKHERCSDNHKRQLQNFAHMSSDYAPVVLQKFEYVCYSCLLGFVTFRDLQIHMLESCDHFSNESKSAEKGSKTTNYWKDQCSKQQVASVGHLEQPQYPHRVTSQPTPITPEPKPSPMNGQSSDKMPSASNDSDVLPIKVTLTPQYRVSYTVPSESVEVCVKQENGEEPFKRYFQYSNTKNGASEC